MHECENYQEMISCLLDGALSPAETDALHAHMAQCEDCRRMYDAFSALSEGLGDSLVEPPAELAPGVMFKIKNTPATKKTNRRWKPSRIAALAACLALVIFTATRFDITGEGQTAAPAAAPEFYSAGADEAMDMAAAPEASIMGEGDMDEHARVTDAESAAPAESANDMAIFILSNGMSAPLTLNNSAGLYMILEEADSIPADAELLGTLADTQTVGLANWESLGVPGDTPVYASPDGEALYLTLPDGTVLCYIA